MSPEVASGKTDHRVMEKSNDSFFGAGYVPMAVTDMKDIGTHTAKIIAGPRRSTIRYLSIARHSRKSRFVLLWRRLLVLA